MIPISTIRSPLIHRHLFSVAVPVSILHAVVLSADHSLSALTEVVFSLKDEMAPQHCGVNQ